MNKIAEGLYMLRKRYDQLSDSGQGFVIVGLIVLFIAIEVIAVSL